jgi:hypothetical protein
MLLHFSNNLSFGCVGVRLHVFPDFFSPLGKSDLKFLLLVLSQMEVYSKGLKFRCDLLAVFDCHSHTTPRGIDPMFGVIRPRLRNAVRAETFSREHFALSSERQLAHSVTPLKSGWVHSISPDP